MPAYREARSILEDLQVLVNLRTTEPTNERRTNEAHGLPGGPSGPRGPGRPCTEIDKFSVFSMFKGEVLVLEFLSSFYLHILVRRNSRRGYSCSVCQRIPMPNSQRREKLPNGAYSKRLRTVL